MSVSGTPDDLRSAPAPAARRAPRAPAYGWIDKLLSAGLVTVALATALATLAALDWWLDLFTHFHLHYFALAAAGLVVSVLRRRGRLALLALALLAVNGAVTFAPYSVGVASAAPADRLTLTQYNLLTENAHHAQTARYLRSTAADVFCLQETDAQWRDDLVAGLPGYEMVAIEPRDDNYGIAMMARRGGRIAPESARVIHPILDRALPLGAVTARAELGGRGVRILTVHAHPPFDKNHDFLRGKLMREVARWTRRQREPVVVCGDFNATPWSTDYRQLLSASGLVNAQQHFGPQPTWMPFFGVLGGLPIDHVLHSKELKTLRYAVGPDTGSDHRGVRVELGFR